MFRPECSRVFSTLSKNTPKVLFQILILSIVLISYSQIARARLHTYMQPARQLARAAQLFNGHAGRAAACGNDARHGVLLEPLPFGLN